MLFSWVSNRENFLLRLTEDGAFEPHSDLVARARVDGVEYRLVVLAATARLRKARAGRARADLIRPQIRALPISPRAADTLYLMALHADGVRGRERIAAWARFRGILRHLWKYGSVGGL